MPHWASLPHARGGVSQAVRYLVRARPSSPRPWGCFFFSKSLLFLLAVFPTPVGVFRFLHTVHRKLFSLPHARGGVSTKCKSLRRFRWSSPRPWGCFYLGRRAAGPCEVFPTPVGVFPGCTVPCRRRPCLPHARGGVSPHPAYLLWRAVSSPRPWGCFPSTRALSWASSVFPTPVGVFPRSTRSQPSGCGLPHARGGVSGLSTLSPAAKGSSPRPWGCFYAGALPFFAALVFPTPVGVFLASPAGAAMTGSLPHARGGVSICLALPCRLPPSSPRPWGCFWRYSRAGRHDLVFPTPVGVFLAVFISPPCPICLPHARGGVSALRPLPDSMRRSSPRPWGCFLYSRGSGRGGRVFPTPVGVFPSAARSGAACVRLPHARGGVSVLEHARSWDDASSPRPWGCF